MNTVDKIKKWVVDRDLHLQDPRVQMSKLIEELGELATAIRKDDGVGIVDGIGDATVVLICLATQLGVDFNGCMNFAYNEIKDRKGKMVDGIFVKEEDL